MVKFTLNGRAVEATATPDTPLLWVIRDELGLMGTKFGCGMAQCGACTIHLNGESTRSCVVPVSAVDGQVNSSKAASSKSDWHRKTKPVLPFSSCMGSHAAHKIYESKPSG